MSCLLYTEPIPAVTGIWAWSPGIKGAEQQPRRIGSGFFSAQHGFVYGGAVRDTRERVPAPLTGRPTRTVLPPSLGRGGGGYQTCLKGASHG